jgi:hypothetical protein
MNYYVIILGAIVLILLYFLYTNYISKSNVLNPLVNLNLTKTTIPYDNLTKKDSTRYSYELWVYVNSWSSLNNKTLLSRGDDFNLYLDKNSPTLKCKFAPQNTGTTQPPEIVITNNFPIQKWTCIIVSVDNQIIDLYLDGKLVLSKKLEYMPTVSIQDISLGDNIRQDIFLAKVVRNPNPMDPQSAWNSYLSGNGQSNNNVNIKMSVLQDNIEQKQFTLF